MVSVFVNLATSSLSLGFLARHFFQTGVCKIYLCDNNYPLNEKGRLINNTIKKQKLYFVQNLHTKKYFRVSVEDFLFLNDAWFLVDEIISADIVYISLDIPVDEINLYLPKLLPFLKLRSELMKTTIVINCNEHIVIDSVYSKISAKIISELTSKNCDVKSLYFLNSFFHVFKKPPLITTNNRIIVPSEYIEGVWKINVNSIIQIDDVSIQKTIFDTLIFATLVDKENFEQEALFKIIQDLVLLLFAFYAHKERFSFLNEYLITVNGSNMFRRVIYALSAIYNIKKEHFEIFDDLIIRIKVTNIKTRDILIWLPEKPSKEEINDFKRWLKFEKIKNYDFRIIEVVCKFLIEIGAGSPLY